jgi:hypothetical protein
LKLKRKSKLPIFFEKGSQNYLFVKSKLPICLWKTVFMKTVL